MLSLTLFLLRRLLLDEKAKNKTSEDNTCSARSSYANPPPYGLASPYELFTTAGSPAPRPGSAQRHQPPDWHPHTSFRSHPSTLRHRHAEQGHFYSSSSPYSSVAAVAPTTPGFHAPPGRFHPLPLLHVPGHRAPGHQLARPRREQGAPRPPPPDRPVPRGPAPPLARREAAPERLHHYHYHRRRRRSVLDGASSSDPGPGPGGCCGCGVGRR